MTNIKISIIVPIYNVELYLKRCLDSLVNQTMKEIEIILVNDASPDASEEIMEEYRTKFPDMIRCIYHEVNLGLGGARNTGVHNAKGEYILFVDSDDYVDVTMCEKLYAVAVKEDSDIVSCEYKEGQENNFREVDQYSTQVMGQLDYEKRRLLMSVHSVGAVAKIVRKNLIVENNLFFPEYIKYEDLATVPLWWVYAKRYGEVKEAMYYYIRRENSITKTKNSAGYYEVFKAAKYIYQRFIDRGLQEEYQECMDNILIRGFIDEIKFILGNIDQPDQEELNALKNDILRLIPDYRERPMLYMRNEPKAIAAADLLMHSVNEFCDMLTKHETDKIKGNYDAYYQLRKERVHNFFSYCEKNHYQVAVWGAGQKGRDFLRVNDPNADYVQYVLDKNEKNWNQILETGHVVRGFQSVNNQVDVVLAVNKVYFGGIYREVKKTDERIKVVNLDLLLMSDKIRDIQEFME